MAQQMAHKQLASTRQRFRVQGCPIVASPAHAIARKPRAVSNVLSPVARSVQLDCISWRLTRGRAKVVASAAAPAVEEQETKKTDERVPVTIITGFLGAGKTTLLNYILTQNHGKRIAVIENEFGAIDIDSELVAKKEVLEGTNDSIMQLFNGCLCCTVRSDLIVALEKLYDRRKEFDHIVIETTGLANPSPIITSFYMDKSLPDKVRLDGVVTVVDAKHVTRHLDAKKEEGVVNEAVEQIAYADRILLNKTDLVSNEDLGVLEERIRVINKMAEIKRTQKSKVEVDYVLGVGGFDLENVEKELNLTLGLDKHDHGHDHDHDHDCAGTGCTHESHAHSHDHAHDHDHDCKGADCGHESHKHDHDHAHAHAHDHGHEHDCQGADCSHESHSHDHKHTAPAVVKHDDKVSSVSILLDGDMDLDKINYSLGLLLDTRAEDIYRMKGLLSIHGSQFRYVYQGVHSIFEGNPDREWLPDEKRQCKMVFIGRDLDAEAFREAFEICLYKEKKAEPAAAGVA